MVMTVFCSDINTTCIWTFLQYWWRGESIIQASREEYKASHRKLQRFVAVSVFGRTRDRAGKYSSAVLRLLMRSRVNKGGY